MRYSFDPHKRASDLKKPGLGLADNIRIISMRKADRNEQSIYRDYLG
jgi:uncharacterized DUF497 family protein